MKESLHKYFQMGTIQWMSHPRRDVVDSVRAIASDDFFDAIELCHFKDGDKRDQVKKILGQSHMKVCYGAQPTLMGNKLNPNDLDEAGRARAESALIEALNEAEYLGARGIALLAGKWSPDTREQAYAQLLKTLRAVCGAAKQKDMIVELEVFDYDMDKAALIGPAPLAARLAADMRCTHANFGLMVDLSHFPTTYETSRDVIRTLRPYITHLHLGNAVVKPGCAAYGDMHPRFGFPNGANDTPELTDYFRVLKDEGFFRADDPLVLSLEVKPWADEEEDLILANTKRVINRAWSLLED